MFTNEFESVYQFRIDLEGIKPPIWRRIQVPDNYSFENLSVAIQEVMDWTVCAGSSYEFEVINPSTGLPERIGCASLGFARFAGIDEPVIRIVDYFSHDRTTFNFTSSEDSQWHFKIVFEKKLPADEFEVYPYCMKGKRAAPPENCGGVEIYREMLDELKKSGSGKKGKATKQFQGLLDDDFDPEYFDPDDFLFTSGSGNPPIPNDLPKRLMKIIERL